VEEQTVSKYKSLQKGRKYMKQLRERLKEHKKKYGTSLAFIGRQIGANRSTLSLFVNEKRSLPIMIAKKLEIYLNNFDN
jgi:DNA transposition AAA+ family ATPase